MEIKEFNSVEEAIEALNNIENIDYSSVDGVDELTERDFYSKLMSNFMGTRNLDFTPEQREKYKAALKAKGLISYREWKDKQPPSDIKVTWAGAAELGMLDAPVNLFSHLLTADNEEKFKFMKDVAGKSVLGRDWIANNEIVTATVKHREAVAKEAIEQTRQEMSEVVKETINERQNETPEKVEEVKEEKVEIKPEIKPEVKPEVKPVEEIKEQPAQENNSAPKKSDFKVVNGYNGQSEFEIKKFETPEEAIKALKTLKAFEYKKGQKIDTVKEKAFYASIMRNLAGCSELKFNDEQAYQYQHALQNLGCKKKSVLEKFRKDAEPLGLPEEYINSIMLSTRANHHQGFKDAKGRAKNNQELNKWIEEAELDLKIQEGLEKASPSKDKDEKAGALVPYKEGPSIFKKIKNYALFAITGVSILFGAAKVKDYSDRVNEANSKNKNTEKEYEKQEEDEKLDKFLEKAGVQKSKLEEELEKDVKDEVKQTHRQIDHRYTKTPDANSEEIGDANKEKMKEVKENREDKEKAEKAQKEAAQKELEVEIKDTDDKNKESDKKENKNKNENKTQKDENKITVEVGDDGKIEEESKSNDNVEEKKDNGDDREVIDMGEIDFGDGISVQSVEAQNENKETKQESTSQSTVEQKEETKQDYEIEIMNDIETDNLEVVYASVPEVETLEVVYADPSATWVDSNEVNETKENLDELDENLEDLEEDLENKSIEDDDLSL